MKKVIINADDFGIHSAVNQAIVELYTSGAISSATLLTNMGASSLEALELAKKYRIPTGLHFNLTLQNERYRNRRDFELNYLRGKIDKNYVRMELAKQYNFMLERGLKPTHLDSHQHIHNWPGIFNILLGFAKANNLPVRLVAEWPIFNKYQKIQFKDLKQLLRKSLFLFLGLLNGINANLREVKTNRALASNFALWPRPDKIEYQNLELILQKLSSKTEFMCHPLASLNSEMQQLTSITDYSWQEYQLFKSDRFLALLKDAEIQLIGFSDL